MTRRALTLSLGTALSAALALGGAVTPVPYVALEPGPTFDTLGAEGTESGQPVIEISGRPTFPTTGKLDLTTVSVSQRLTLGAALWGWFDRDKAVLPREIVYPPDKSDEEVEADNEESMQESQDTATAAALRVLKIRSEVVTVDQVPTGPSTGKLQPGDVIVEVDGQPVLDGSSLRELIGARQPGETVRIGFRRDSGAAQEVTVTTSASPADPANPDAAPRPVIGVVTRPTPVRDITVDINLKDVGGPSAGLMFALGIVDKLDKVDITGGRHIAGTGEMAADGRVGPIGGISQKLIGARRKGATVFLVPADNCAEAKGSIPDGLTLIKAATLRDALVGLRVLRDGGVPEGC